MANTLISVTPRLEQIGLVLPEAITANEKLATRLENEVVGVRSQILGQFNLVHGHERVLPAEREDSFWRTASAHTETQRGGRQSILVRLLPCAQRLASFC